MRRGLFLATVMCSSPAPSANVRNFITGDAERVLALSA
jgi:hypothetical protein